MKIRNWKLEIGNLFIILLFLIIPLSFPSSVSAQCVVQELGAPTNIIEKIITLFFGLFTKTDYSVQKRDISIIQTDMNDYGNKDDEDFDKKHAFAGSRSQDSYGQNCLKGNVIKQVVMGTFGYKNAELAQICLEGNCSIISVDDLANYFVQTNEQFYCDDNNKLVDIESSVIDKVNLIEDLADITIPDSKKTCYQQIYDDFYITPKDNIDINEKNVKNIIKTPISGNDQIADDDAKAIKKQLDLNFIPFESGWDGLNSLRPGITNPI